MKKEIRKMAIPRLTCVIRRPASRFDMISVGFYDHFGSGRKPRWRTTGAARDSQLFYNRRERGSLSPDYRPEFTTNSHKIVHEVLRAWPRVGTAGPGERETLSRCFIVFIYNWDSFCERDTPTTGSDSTARRRATDGGSQRQEDDNPTVPKLRDIPHLLPDTS